ncbi:hypothetical protein EGP95_00080 [bacterium]|nr:hypothetical protein [bacterium]
MNKDEYIKIVNKNEYLDSNGKKILIEQIGKYYEVKNYSIKKDTYNIGDEVKLKKGTLLHGTYKNIDGLKEILKDGLISSWFIDGRISKYPSSVGIWNLKKDYYLKDYIDLYSGGTIMYCGVFENGKDTQQNKTEVIPYTEMTNIIDMVSKVDCHMWTLEQTKEARFMPSLVQDRVQIGIIFNGSNKYLAELLKGDILNPNNINDNDVKPFVNQDYYEKFIKNRKSKDDFFTDRESAILFGIPSNFIEGILVGRKYENDNKILVELKTLLPDAYICNLDGKVIVANK